MIEIDTSDMFSGRDKLDNKQEAGTRIWLTDSAGTELLSWTAEKEYSSVIISCPEIKQGETYTLAAGTAEESITMDSLVYGNSSQMGGRPGGGGGMKDDGMKGNHERGDMPGGSSGGSASENGGAIRNKSPIISANGMVRPSGKVMSLSAAFTSSHP